MSADEAPVGPSVQDVARKLVEDQRVASGLPNNRAGRREAERIVRARIGAHKRAQAAAAAREEAALERADLDGSLRSEVGGAIEAGHRRVMAVDPARGGEAVGYDYAIHEDGRVVVRQGGRRAGKAAAVAELRAAVERSGGTLHLVGDTEDQP